jgi:hypothetical protein
MRRRGKRTSTLGLLPSLFDPPPETQIISGKLQRGTWVDPEDLRPNASKGPRLIHGHRAFCPLRRCRARHGDRTFSEEHCLAADRLRGFYDGARLGFQGMRDWRPVQAIAYRPSTGPSTTAMRQLRCRQQFDRAWSLFDQQSRAVLVLVVLKNLGTTIAAEALGISKNLLSQRLVEALDRLVEFWDLGQRRAA